MAEERLEDLSLAELHRMELRVKESLRIVNEELSRLDRCRQLVQVQRSDVFQELYGIQDAIRVVKKLGELAAPKEEYL